MAITRSSKGTASEKTSGTTLTLADASFDAGELVFVAIVSLGGITQQSAKWGLYPLEQYGVAWNFGTSMSVSLYYIRARRAITRDLVVTWVSSIGARAMAVFGVKEASVLDAPKINNADDATTAPDSGESFVATSEDDNYVMGLWGSNGPVEDAAGTVGNGLTGYQRVGTTGDAATSNVTLHEAGKIISTAAKIQASKTGCTSRDWVSVAIAFKARQTFTVEACEQRHIDQNQNPDWVWVKIEDESADAFWEPLHPEDFDDMSDSEVTDWIAAAAARWANRNLDDESNIDEDTTRDTRMAGFVNDTVII